MNKTTDDPDVSAADAGADAAALDAARLDLLNENMARVEALSQRLVAALGARRPIAPSLQGPGQDLLMKAGIAYMGEVMANPSKIFENQVEYWGRSVKHFIEAQQQLVKGRMTPPEDPGPKDRRFQNPLWDSHPWFNYIKQQYLMSSQALTRAADAITGLDDTDRQSLSYFTRQIVDLMAPTNFLATNPDALERAVETDGQSLVAGLENLVRDIEANNGELLVTLADPKAFRVGGNLATTPGSVVFRNRMFELIQFAPTTDKVHRTPLVIFPPWINKYYVLDLKPENSLIRWIVDQGHTLFVVSWVNPDASFADVGLDTYVEEGYLTALREVKAITGQKKVNTVGYCIAGTTLSLTLALMAQRGDRSVKSATLFTTLTDFADQGEFAVFLTDSFVDGIEAEVKAQGFLQSFFMSRTFSYLRSNDLIYQPAIRAYMMGEAPPAFDLLYWNGDGTNLPGRMAVDYLRGLCQENRLAGAGMSLMGKMLKLSDIDVPVCAIACEADHIAAWKASHAGLQKFGTADRTFILSQSGHIAGIINPPAKRKYGHYTNPDLSLSAADWRAGAAFHEGSWWPRWGEWLAGHAGAMVAARNPGDSEHPELSPAPGTYVRRRASG